MTAVSLSTFPTWVRRTAKKEPSGVNRRWLVGITALTSLWRGNDPVKPSETYEQDSAEKEEPFFRAKIHNR
jgi:hypothetical protein